MASDIDEPLNLGSDESVTINQLVDMVEEIAGITLTPPLRPERHPKASTAETATTPKSASAGLGARRSDLRDGLEKTYRWIYDQMTTGRDVRVGATAGV